MPRPIITALDKPYWAFLRKHEFRLQKCSKCNAFRFPASPVCAKCGSLDFKWELCSRRGTVFSWVVFHKAYFAALQECLPYNVAMVELEDGPMFISNIVEITNEDIRKGLQVEIVFDDMVYEDLSIPKFKPLG